MITKQMLQLPNGEVLGVFDTFDDAFLAKGTLPDRDFIASRIYPVNCYLSREPFHPKEKVKVPYEKSPLPSR